MNTFAFSCYDGMLSCMCGYTFTHIIHLKFKYIKYMFKILTYMHLLNSVIFSIGVHLAQWLLRAWLPQVSAGLTR